LAVWIAAWLPLALALLVLTLPGALIAGAAGQRSMSLVALAPVLSISALSVSAIAAPVVGLRWGVVPAVLGTLLAAGATLLLRIGFARKFGWAVQATRWGYGFTPAVGVALALGASVLLYRLARIFGRPEYVSQTADNVFHLNAVRYILETGSASSLTVGGAGGSAPSFYPAAWHGVAALIVEISGASIPSAVACLNLVIGAAVWPLSMWFFCRTLLGNSIVMNIGFGVLISSFSAFPYLLVDWGVIYPNYLGMAALPAVAGIGLLVFRNTLVCSGQGMMLPWLGLIALAGVSLGHPNSVICLIVILVPYLASRVFRRSVIVSVAKGVMPGSIAKIVAGLGVAAGIAAAWIVLRPFPFTSYDITWPPYQSSAQAVGEALLTTHSARGAAWGTGVLLIGGLVLAFRHRGYRWLAASFLVWALLSVAVTAWQPSVVRAFLTGGWFDDYKRIAAGLVIVSLPLALLGFIGVSRAIAKHISRMPSRNSVLGNIAPILLIALPVFVIAHTGAIRDASIAAKKNYSLGPGSPIMSADEFKLYEELPDLVPDGKVIAGNPWDGSAWAYFVSGKPVLFPHVLAAMDEDEALIARSLRTAASDPAVCAAAERLNVQYAINSDELIYLPGNPNNQAYPGVAGLDSAPGFQLVSEVGANRLYKLVAC
jgi:hypothetical protein